MKICSLDECTNKYHGKGYCQRHYDKLRDHNDPYYDNSHDEFCNINDCNNKYHAKGLCMDHYNKQKYNENPKLYNEKSRNYYEQNTVKCKELHKNYRLNNKNRCNELARIWKNNNPDKILKSQIRELEKLSKSFSITTIEYRRKLRLWSVIIKKLDNHMCKNCDSTENLNAHHIYPKSEYPEFSLDLDKGVTLCVPCHGELHGYHIY